MGELTQFTDALRAAVPARPGGEFAASLVPRLAATARTATIEAETRPSPRPAGGPMRRSRWAVAAWLAIVVVSVPLLLAGLAVAGVTVPAPARDAFHSVGITLPNQPSGNGRAPAARERIREATPAGVGNEVSNAARSKPKGKGGNSAAAHEHARKQHEKARGKAEGHGGGKAVGVNGSTPPGQAKTPPGQAKKTTGAGEATPPGQAKTPPGQAEPRIPPGQAKAPPGQSK